MLAFLAPAIAAAKAPNFTDLVNWIRVVGAAQAGGEVPVEARVDVGAYCARTEYFGGERCPEIAEYGLERPAVRWVRDELDWSGERWRASVIEGALTQGEDGVYRGRLRLLPCQEPGIYRIQTIEPNPTFEAVRLAVEGALDCTADETPPEPLALIASPEQIQLKVEDDFAGVWRAAARVEGPDGSAEVIELACSPCESPLRHLCTALHTCPSPGTYTVRVEELVDGAGRAFEQGGPVATFSCGGSQPAEPASFVACERDLSNDVAMLPHPPFVPRGGCASAAAAGQALAGLILALVQRRRTSRGAR